VVNGKRSLASLQNVEDAGKPNTAEKNARARHGAKDIDSGVAQRTTMVTMALWIPTNNFSLLKEILSSGITTTITKSSGKATNVNTTGTVLRQEIQVLLPPQMGPMRLFSFPPPHRHTLLQQELNDGKGAGVGMQVQL
jgi:hypothetical protein